MPNLYVEGFVLNDGAGFFYPTLVKNEAGDILVDEDERYALLDRVSDIYGGMLGISPMFLLLILVFAWKFIRIKFTLAKTTQNLSQVS